MSVHHKTLGRKPLGRKGAMVVPKMAMDEFAIDVIKVVR